jgi:PAS domain S-box-containing protein
MVGMEEKELHGMDFFSFISDEQAERCIQKFQELITRETDSISEDIEVYSPSGKFFWGKFSVSIIFDNNNTAQFIVGMMDDVTERKTMLEELAKKSEYVQKVLDFQANIILVTDGEEILNCNKSFLDFLGLRNLNEFKAKKKDFSEYFIKEPDLIIGEDEQGWLEEVFQNFRLGLESKVKMRDTLGAVRTFQINFRILPMTAGEYIVSLTDITDLENYHKILKDANRILEIIVNERTEELRNTNKMLESSRQQLEQAQQIATIGSWEWNNIDRTIHGSKELFRIFGIKTKDYKMNDEHFLSYVAEDDREILRKVVFSTQNFTQEFDEYIRISRTNGEKRILRLQGRIKAEDSGVIYLLGTAHDITELKRVESALRQNEQFLSFIFDSASFGICVVDERGSFVRLNRKFCEILHLNENYLKNKNLFDIFPEADPSTDMKATEWKWESADGEVTDLLVTAGSLMMEENKQHYIYSIADITEKNRIEKIHREQEQMLIQQSKLAALGEMIGAIAHQWKQPLNSASLYAQLIEDDYEFNELTKEKLSEYVNEIMHQLNFMAQTVEDFRNFFTPSKTVSEFSITSAVDDVLVLMKSSIDKHKINVEIKTDFKGEDDAYIYGYPSEFKQVMVNLLSNSKDAIDSKRASMPPLDRRNIGNITISIFNTDRETVVELSDDGGGIPAEAVKKIFESYFTTKGEEGTGIGLYMSRMIIENRMKGTISAGNKNNGALFTMRFPLISQT